jgi:ABC-type multidrug transport system ATPase subunit
MSQNNYPLIQFEKVSFRYDKQQEYLLKDVSFEVHPGDRIGIMGGNGSGKSTIAKLILGIYRSRQGEVLYNGTRIKWSNHYPEIAYVGDPGYNAEELGLPSDLRVDQVLKLFVALYTGKIDLHYFQYLKEGLGLKAIAHKNIRTLSTGERKRVMIALALTKRPALLLLDEPIDGLDKKSKRLVRKELKALAHTQTAFLYIAHDLTEIDTHTNRSFLLEKGRLHPRNSPLYAVQVDQNGSSCAVEEKLGEVQGRISHIIAQGISKDGFSISVKPINHEVEY